VNNLYNILQHSAENYPNNTALVFNDNPISYANVKDACDRLASGFRKLGLGPGDRMAMMLPNSPHFPICFFALLKIGVTIIPLSIQFKVEEIRHRLEDSEAKGIIFWERFRSDVHQAIQDLSRCRKLLVLGEKADPNEVRLNYLMEVNDPLDEIIDADSEETALISYTAGITGRPIGAELTHENLLFDMNACKEFLKLHSDDSVIGVLPLSHPLGHTLILGTFFRSGGTVHLVSKFDAETILKTIQEKSATYFVCVPSMIHSILETEDGGKYDLSSLKFCLSSGDALKPETMEEFESRFHVSILEGYGLTEASPMVSFNSTVMERRAGSIGLPLPGVDMKIVDEDGIEVKPGQIGEIIIQGPNVMKGYLNRPEATKEALRGGWLRTGDLAELHENGFCFIVVRKKNVIVKSGFNVYPREVEKFLLGHSKVSEAVVVGIPDSVQGEEVHTCIVLKKDENIDAEEILTYCRDRMATYKCPRFVHFVESLPKGPTGRILRDQVKQMLIENTVPSK
jgi:long-chain acyl-CoA synthetase